VIVTDVRELIAQDRCDKCGAQARVIATFLNGELMFCGHHAKEIKASLQIKAATIYDPDNLLV
jgi:hypothetical protein